MVFRCLDCNKPIDGDPWWYDPSAFELSPNDHAIPLTVVVSQRPDPTTTASAPFHKECLEKQMGRSI